MLTNVALRKAAICAALALAVVELRAQNPVPVEDRSAAQPSTITVMVEASKP
jgi:hypothetical protein